MPPPQPPQSTTLTAASGSSSRTSRTPSPSSKKLKSSASATNTKYSNHTNSTHSTTMSTTTTTTTTTKKRKPTRSVSFALPALPFPLARLLHPLRSAANQWLVVPGILMVAFLFRWAVGLGGYSGMASPPMHGDFEAQRHWMEITIHLPIKEWYFHDLEWWGLDYPPLTAYHSWLCGKIGTLINPTWFGLYTSRALDDYYLKLYMRSTSLLSEFLIYIPSLLLLIRSLSNLPTSKMTKYDIAIATTSILLQPGLILIDHGHFQFNSVMLGFTLASLAMFLRDHLLWGSFFFVLSLGFKQMALYYSPAVFAYLLGLCVFPRINILKLTAIAIATLSTFLILLLPLILSNGITNSLPILAQTLHRCFPFSRGLWEDKVANLWCALNPIIKFRNIFSTPTLQRLSLLTTLITITPPCLILFFNPRKHLLPLTLSASAWGFFLCSFQVHEKSVLLPLLPLTVTLAQGVDREIVSWVTWTNLIAGFSMWPLLKRDGLALQYSVLMVFWGWLMGALGGGKWSFSGNTLGKMVQVGGYLGVVGLHGLEVLVENLSILKKLFPSNSTEWVAHLEKKVESLFERFPDLIVVGNVFVCFCAFAWMYVWTVGKLWNERLRDGPGVEAVGAGGGKRKRE